MVVKLVMKENTPESAKSRETDFMRVAGSWMVEMSYLMKGGGGVPSFIFGSNLLIFCCTPN